MNSVVNKHLYVAFDVDGTLISYNDKPRYSVIDLYNHFANLGCKMIIWSGGGKDYAANWASKLGLECHYVACKFGSHEFPKPNIAVDDEIESQLGHINIYV